ncbi:glycoside hydrolase domain-containing protein [Halalkalibacterium halodurans]|uniref:glycoside hydrolase domain-containing protein n=1 Tax=Halalkalibacterium halodurans TaxID=86665 RepID=UPI002AA9E98D|nr:glycoside hydrolase domain-containing protein [Halalkalibacterium halodurans]MDY7222768.1 DUF1906 domain-containing protein [Halalkalibacterium halodurans]MDY7241989.1 DUF1906 domain-containing protein [Halalkalibacterium halodurans]
MKRFCLQGIVLLTAFLLAISSFVLFVVRDDYETGQLIHNEKPSCSKNVFIYYTEKQVEITNEKNDDQKEKGNGEEDGVQEEEPSGEDESGEDESGEEQEGQRDGDDLPEIVWGVDSVNVTDSSFLDCVTTNFGSPTIWGRYLGDKEDVSYGLTPEEIELLHDHDISILIIYNQFIDATGYETGVNEAEGALAFAEELGIPEGVAIFANVEPEYPVDGAFLAGWYDTLTEANYPPALYGLFDDDSNVTIALEEAREENETIFEELILWSNQPQVGITSEENAPDSFDVNAPDGSRPLGWQYGLEADTCNIDTNLFVGEMLNYTWGSAE